MKINFKDNIYQIHHERQIQKRKVNTFTYYYQKNKNNCDNLLESKDHTLLSGISNLPDMELERMVLNYYFKVK